MRGVNQQIIEINELENSAFYKAILFVRPDHSGTDASALEHEAQTVVYHTLHGETPPQNGYLRKRGKWKRLGLLIMLAVSALSATGIWWLFLR